MLTDLNMLLDYEIGVRGGITRVLRHYTESNNKYINDYDKSKESTYVLFLDFSNQFWYSLTKKRPYGGQELLKDISMFTTNFTMLVYTLIIGLYINYWWWLLIILTFITQRSAVFAWKYSN